MGAAEEGLKQLFTEQRNLERRTAGVRSVEVICLTQRLRALGGRMR
jgi:hypothetical protein